MILPVRPYSALLIRRKEGRDLIIADLHIGWEVALTQRGIHIPSQTHKLLNNIRQLIKSTRATSLIFLGDVKHSVANTQPVEWQEVPSFFEAVGKHVSEIKVVPGNHDGNLEPLLPADVEILPTKGVSVGNVGFFHGHTWPSPKLLQHDTIVIGHVHPIISLSDPLGFRVSKQVWVKVNCDGARLAASIIKRLKIKVNSNDVKKVLKQRFNIKLRTSQLLVMPAFNNFLGGQPINKIGATRSSRFKMFISPIFRSGSLDTDSAEIYLLDGSFLGVVKHLKTSRFL